MGGRVEEKIRVRRGEERREGSERGGIALQAFPASLCLPSAIAESCKGLFGAPARLAVGGGNEQSVEKVDSSGLLTLLTTEIARRAAAERSLHFPTPVISVR